VLYDINADEIKGGGYQPKHKEDKRRLRQLQEKLKIDEWKDKQGLIFEKADELWVKALHKWDEATKRWQKKWGGNDPFRLKAKIYNLPI
jgi:hypothetical protein